MQFVQSGKSLNVDNLVFDAGYVARRKKLDQTEKSSIALTLSTITRNRSDEETIELRDITVPRITDTTFDIAQEFARVALSKMLKSREFLFLAEQHSLPVGTVFCIDERARLRGLIKGVWIEISPDKTRTTDLQDDILMLSECAVQTGGYLFSGDIFGVAQWLRFHEYTLPETVAQVRSLVAFLQFEIPQSPDTGDWHQLLREPADSPFHLTADARKTISLVTEELKQGRSSLLKFIATEDLSQVPEPVLRERAADYLESLLDSSKARALGEVLHQRLEWHLEQNDPEVLKRQIRYLAATALILDLQIDVEQHAKMIDGFSLYQPANASKTSGQVVRALGHHLMARTPQEPELGPLMAHLLLAGAAPQFLVQQTPAELTIGKPGWVILSQAVALIELAAPGASRLMTYAQIKDFSELAPVSVTQRALYELTTITPVIQWAMLNGVLSDANGTNYEVSAFTTAANRFSEYVEALNETETGISAVPPDRRAIALQALQRVLPAGGYLQQRIFKIRHDASFGDRNVLEWLRFVQPLSHLTVDSSQITRLRASILDLYMSGDLSVNGKFTEKFIPAGAFNPPAGAFSRLSELESVDHLFDKAFDEYYSKLQKSLAIVIKIAISNLPERDRTMLSNGLINLYTVRKSVNPLNPFQETQRHRNAAKGRYGIIIGCQHDKELRCYELFPLKGLIRERPEMATMLVSSGVIHDTPSLSYKGKDTDFQDKLPELSWPLDFAAYKDGSESKTGVISSVVVEKLCSLALASDERLPIPLFFSGALDALAESLLGCHPVATREELYASLNTQTSLQRIRAENNAIDQTIVNVIVPFKKCIEDIRSGDAPRVSEGIGGCTLDGLALLGLAVGFGAKIAGIAGRTISTTAKARNIAKASAHFAVSIFNPLDGLPTLAVQGGRLAKNGALLLSKHGLNVVETATGQLRKLTGGAQTYDLLKAAQKSDLFQGTWKAAGNPGNPVELLALQRNSDWYALNLRVGGAWGPNLRNIKVSPLAPFRWLLGRVKPFSYTRSYVKKALPVARSKLDNALSMLLETGNAEMRTVLKHVFGNDSDEVLKQVMANLQNMRDDLDFVRLSHMSFKKGSEANAALRPAVYKRWKTSVLERSRLKQRAERFLVIYPEGLDEYYRMANYDDGRIADALVHEMAHGAPDTLDLYYGSLKEAGSGPAGFDVAGLLQLGSTRNIKSLNPKNIANLQYASAHAKGLEEFDSISRTLPELINRHPALYNADSYSLAVSMLDQARTHREAFLANLEKISRGLKNTSDLGFIKGSVQINLARASI